MIVRSHWLLLALFGASIAVAASSAEAQITANFTDGNGTGSSDSYDGIAGNGWAGGWGRSIAVGSFTTHTVVNTTPLNGGGNYLNAVFTGGVSGNLRGWVRRDYNNFGGISATQAHRIEFDFRLDTSLSAFTNVNDYFALYDNPTAQADTGAASTWMLRAHGANSGGSVAQQWAFYDGDTASTAFNAARWVDSGIDLVTGNAYHFIIDTNPTNNTYQVTIQDLTAATQVTSGVLNFRSIQNNPLTAGTVLHFGGSVNTASETLGFSLDSLSITAVPEPSTWALLGLAASFGLCRVVRRRR